ncbi:hypothetical protein CFK37_00310 [Virgibacillus phasianinus]|uniref:Uncharacterized protein n=1 Tax=Virgibacillus phasianinus TaxID=2017483 RepID=A0A220TY29_9BACI|nr:hypothetical protein [Virgibacillus phasianinus]ASK60758.1 hypothetical protein CFK37_00310 [Virgibacillus phasianinus]
MRSTEKLFWSIALPGLGQLLNGKYLKGIVLILLEFLINVQSHLNMLIVLSFHGKIEEAIQLANYNWLMFYPCVYLFGIWDAYRDDGCGRKPYSFLPFVSAAYIATVGVVCSSSFKILGVLWGPIWLPILFILLGALVGIAAQKIIIRVQNQE